VPALPAGISGEKLVDWSAAAVAEYDAAIIVTPHPDVDHGLLVGADPVVVDTRNALRGERAANIVKL
jgi:hypothetical protein